MTNANPGVSVLIRTRNRKQNLSETLKSLARQEADALLKWEVVLVDNASDDDILSFSEQKWKHYGTPVPLRTFSETRIGKANALKTGVAQCNYNYVIICDDDNWLSKDYVQRAFDIMSNNDEIGLLGGMGIPAFEQDRPYWYDAYEKFYSTGEQHAANGAVEPGIEVRYIWGAGAVLNKTAYAQLLHAGFEEMRKTNPLADEADCSDVELSLAIQLTGYKLWYDNSLVFFHYIPKERVPWSFLMKRVRQRAKARPYLLISNAIHVMKIDTETVDPADAYNRYYRPYKQKFMQGMMQSLRKFQGFMFFLRCITETHIESHSEYFQQYIQWRVFFSWSTFGKRKFMKSFKALSELRNKARTTTYQTANA